MFEKVVIVDGRSHVLGRLAATIAKELLLGQNVVIVRCEEVNISGSLFRNQLKFTEFLNKRTNTNPARGPIHHRAPGRIVARCIRGMIPHKTARGQAAMGRLKTFEGMPHPYDKMKKQVIPDALKYLRLRPGRKFCSVGDLAQAFGWKHKELISKLETKRKTKGAAYYATKKALASVKKESVEKATGELAAIDKKLAEYGYGTLDAIAAAASASSKKKEVKEEKPTPKPTTTATTTTASASTTETKKPKAEPKAASAPPPAKVDTTAATATSPKSDVAPKGGKGKKDGGAAPKDGGAAPKEAPKGKKGKKPAADSPAE
jgi:large subunit ribosomal protein L13Ae